MIRVAMLSKWHVHAEGYARDVQNSGVAKITCVWDEDARRGRAWAEELGVDFEADLAACLAREDVDAVVIDTPTSDHRDVMVAAANAGKHIFTEKAMAPTLAECREITAAVEKNGVKFAISHPQLTSPFVQYAKKVLAEGLLGEVKFLRLRSAHDGSSGGWLPDYWYDVEKAGGGAMMDLGCHPMYTAAWLLGKPKRITSMFNNSYALNDVDDNAVSVVEFENGAIAVLETGFVTPWSGGCTELLGTEGALVMTDGVVKLRSKKLGVDGWVIPAALPKPMKSTMALWFDGILNDSPIPFGTAEGEALTNLLEQAYVSDRDQTIVAFE
ncbi:MAG: Gfo/Idh/MocA family oxidoreductase [Bacillota bacterium]|nr:Gfo/Idh/MocA family oxidoreductase [Bacillota bacterium]